MGDAKMRTMNIRLHSMGDVKEFSNIINQVEDEVTLCDGLYTVNAKSIMSIFSIRLSEPLKLTVENWKEEYTDLLDKYMI